MAVHGKNDGLFVSTLNAGCAVILVIFGVFLLLPVFAGIGLGGMVMLGLLGICLVVYLRYRKSFK